MGRNDEEKEEEEKEKSPSIKKLETIFLLIHKQSRQHRGLYENIINFIC